MDDIKSGNLFFFMFLALGVELDRLKNLVRRYRSESDWLTKAHNKNNVTSPVFDEIRIPKNEIIGFSKCRNCEF